MIEQWIDMIKTIFEKYPNTNCYDNIDHLIETLENTHDITITERLTSDTLFSKLYNIFIRNLKANKCFLYRIDILVKKKEIKAQNKAKNKAQNKAQNKPTTMFSHSFCVFQCKNHFTICDSWEGIHFMRCREYTTWPLFSKWLDKLHSALYTYIGDLFELFIENPWSNKKGKFEKDIKILKDQGAYINEWSSLKISDKDVISMNIEYFSIPQTCLKKKSDE